MVRLVIVALILVAADAHANVGRRDFPGMRSTEPGGLRAIAIEREELTFDLRGLATHDGARISATYHLDNRGSAITAPLVFVGGSDRRGSLAVTLDGRDVNGGIDARVDVASFPQTWRAPVTTPSLDGDEPIGYGADPPAAYSFTIEITPGRHTLQVIYTGAAERTKTHGDATILWQLGYVLAPARDWGSFGTLDVTAHVPPGWRVAVSPPLERTGDTLRGRFTGLPGDSIGITTQAEAGVLHTILVIVRPVLLLAAILGGIYVLYALGRRRARNVTDIGGSNMLALGWGLLWAIAIAVTGCFAALGGELGIPDGQSAAHGYGPGLGAVASILGALIAIPIGFAIFKAGARVER
jgi:hypothetical protein